MKRCLTVASEKWAVSYGRLLIAMMIHQSSWRTKSLNKMRLMECMESEMSAPRHMI